MFAGRTKRYAAKARMESKKKGSACSKGNAPRPERKAGRSSCILVRPHAHSNDGGWLPGQESIDFAPEPDKPIEHENLKAAKSPPFENTPVHKPCRPGWPIEMDHRFNMKACIRKLTS